MMYQGIDDMNQAAWRKMGKLEGDEALKCIFIDLKKITRKTRKSAEIRQQEIKDQWFNETYIDDDKEVHILKMVKRARLLSEILIKPDGRKITEYRLLDAEIKAAESNIDVSDNRYTENKGHLTKYMGGGWIDESKISIREFHSWFVNMQAESERIKAANIKNFKKS